MAKLTQLQRVDRAGWAAGSRGITQVEMNQPGGPDGKGPIARLAARIGESRDKGARWADGGTRDGHKIYVLDRSSLADSTKPAPTSVPSTGSTSSPQREPAGGTGALFTIGKAQQCAINDDWESAA